MSNEKPILKVENLRKQFGPGCDHCRNPEESSLKRITVLNVELYMLVRIYHLKFIRVKY